MSASKPDLETQSDGFTKVLTRDEKRKMRKVEGRRPQFQFDISYFRQGKKIGIAHIRDLVLHLVADGQKPSWIVAENKHFITHTVMLFVPGLLPQHLGLPQIEPSTCLPFSTSPAAFSAACPGSSSSQVPIISKLFTYGVPSRAPGDRWKLHSVMSTLLNSPVPDAIRKKLDGDQKDFSGKTGSAFVSSDPRLYVLSPNELIANEYPIPSYVYAGDVPVIPGLSGEVLAAIQTRIQPNSHPDLAIPTFRGSFTALTQGRKPRYGEMQGDDWIETPEATSPPHNGRYDVLAIDCEMCQTDNGKELTRISIVDFHSGSVVLDELVMPSAPITDYLTRWSGITESRLSTATHTLSTIQQALLNPFNPIISPHTILLGHSLECDLRALRLRHALCIDTSLLYQHPKGPSFKAGLKWLSAKWLAREIQGDEGGHDSEEDARACVDLLKMKLAQGPHFGTVPCETEPIFLRIARSSQPKQPAPTADVHAPRSDTMPRGKTASIHYSQTKSYGTSATTQVVCENDDAVVEAIRRNITSHDLIFGHLREVVEIQGWHNYGVVGDAPPPPMCASEVRSALRRLNNRLQTIHSALPTSTALVLLTGHSDPRPMLELASKRARWEAGLRSNGIDSLFPNEKWYSDDDRRLEDAVAACREGMAFFCIK